MTIERWASITGWEGYEVSDQGHVRSLPGQRRHGKVLAPAPAGRGYLQVTLCRTGEQRKFYIHHLVAEAFIGARPPGTEVCHGGADFLDNRAVNLRYDTHGRNMAQTVIDGTNQYSHRATCDHGHDWTEANTRTEQNGTYQDGTPRYRRRCRECLAVKSAADYIKWKARHGK